MSKWLFTEVVSVCSLPAGEVAEGVEGAVLSARSQAAHAALVMAINGSKAGCAPETNQNFISFSEWSNSMRVTRKSAFSAETDTRAARRIFSGMICTL